MLHLLVLKGLPRDHQHSVCLGVVLHLLVLKGALAMLHHGSSLGVVLHLLVLKGTAFPTAFPVPLGSCVTSVST